VPEPTEWEFTADVAKWVQQALDSDPSLPFSQAKCETRTPGSDKRNDLILRDKDDRPVLTGEVKLPWQPHGGTPFNDQVVNDARAKAKRAKVGFFFTWNVNQFILWEVFAPKTAHTQRPYRTWRVTSVHRGDQLYSPMALQAIQAWLAAFLADFAAIIRGQAPLGLKLPDEQFTDRLEAALDRPIALTVEELAKRYKEPRAKSQIDAWMRDELGMTITDDPDGVRDNLDRAARFACYGLVNRLVFYEALLKRYRRQMDPISIPADITTGEGLRVRLEFHFARAVKATHDYETVFGEDHASFGERVPFYPDHAVAHWREIVAQIHQFDFSKLDYEVIGALFERFISPEERSKFGQFYTRVEVVDLINSFAIRTGDAKVMDPACGGGTFLVRAYARKRELDRARSHPELLQDLFGVDISPFATHLTTINLATRDLVEEENYPQIARSNFFDVARDKPLRQLPMPRTGRVGTKGHGKGQFRNVWIPHLDAVVGNPPYIRQEEIPRSHKKRERGLEPGTKDYYLDLVRRESGAELSGRSDIHCYFWPHAASLLKSDGFLGLITSSQWLDVEYGFRLQEWLLRNFEIVAILESVDEPWFVGARVATAVTILRRQCDDAARMANVVRFVQLRKPIRDILAHDGTTIGAVRAADAFRDEIMALTANTVNDHYRARLVPQAKLWHDGVNLGILMGVGTRGSRVPQDSTSEPLVATPRPPEGGTTNPMAGKYYGGKWGVYLRAPDLWFELLDRYGHRLVPLAQIAQVLFGIKSGEDSFFLPVDCTQTCLGQYPDAADFEAQFSLPRCQAASGKVKLVRCGEELGEIMPVEAQYLQPVPHSIMEIAGFSVRKTDCARLMFLCGEPRDHLAGSYALAYIAWGEANGWHENKSCACRVTADRPWYDITGHAPAPVLWPKERQYRHIAPANPEGLLANCRLYEIHPATECGAPALWGGILNSSWSLLSSLQYGRPMGTEGNWSTMVSDVNMMVVPAPTEAPEESKERVSQAFRVLDQRLALCFLSERRLRRMAYLQAGKEAELARLSDLCELDMADRRELDDAVLEMMGETSPERRKELIDRLYAYLREFFEQVRQKEEKAIANKKRAKRRGAAKPAEVAAEILAEIKAKEPHLLQAYDPGFLDPSKPYDTYELPSVGEPSQGPLAPHIVEFRRGKKLIGAVHTKNTAHDDLLVFLARSGVRGLVRVPHDEEECRRVYERYGDFAGRRDERLRALIQDRTADEEMQGRINDILVSLLERAL